MKSRKEENITPLLLPQHERGYSLVEMLITMIIFFLVIGVTTSEFFLSTRRAYDRKTVAFTQEHARALVDLMSFDLRMMGAGMPLGQANFTFTNPSIGDAALPMDATSGSDSITLKFNEKGASTLTTADFSPSAFDLSTTVLSAADFDVGDELYISNLSAGGDLGFRGTISSIAGDVITFNGDFNAQAGITLEAGSNVHRVSTVTYQALPDSGGIVRTWDDSSVNLTPNSTFTITYRDAADTELLPPLTQLQIANSLAKVTLSVSVEGDRPLINGDTYIATFEQDISLRNLILNR